MAITAELPSLPGLSWSVVKAPKFATRIQTAISGRELRVLDQLYPIWTWTLTYEFLRDQNDTHAGNALGTGYDELRSLMGFFLQQQGAFQPFLYYDKTDYSVTNQLIGFGDGSNKVFQLVRTMAHIFTEPITQPAVITGIYVNGVSVAYGLGDYGVVTLSSAPAPAAGVTATFLYKWPVRFVADMTEFENFMYQLWSNKKLQFQSVLLP
jgi:uncharacterized protein (TIGR02217 family)